MKVAIYCRLSEEDKNKQLSSDDSESIQNQKSMLMQYAFERSWQVYNIYSDDNFAGADRNRPEFQKLLADAEKRKFDIILCKTQSRFTRELEIVEKYIHGYFPQWNIRFISVVDNADTEIKGNKKARQINGLINEWYLEDMSDNIKSVLTNRRKQGFHIGAFPLYGYIKDPKQKGHLIIDDEAAEIVREVFTLYSQGYGKTAIARILNDRGIPNPTAYRVAKGYHRNCDLNFGKLWKYYAISDMLINEMYIGNMVQGKYGSISFKTKKNKPIKKDNWIIVENTHEPIIDKELWDNVQSKVNANFKPFTTGKIGIFAKKVKCMNCGYTMRSTKSRDKHYLQCTTKHIARDNCIGAFVSYELLSQTIINEINAIVREYLNKNEFEQKISTQNNLDKKKEMLQNQIKSYEKKINEYSKGIKELYFDKVKGIISEDNFIEFSKDFYIEKEKNEKLLKETIKQLEEIETKSEITDYKKSIFDEYTNITELNREMVEKLIDYILVGRRNLDKQLPIEIHWNI